MPEMKLLSDKEIEKCFGDEPQAQNFDQLLADFYERLKRIAKVQLNADKKVLEQAVKEAYKKGVDHQNECARQDLVEIKRGMIAEFETWLNDIQKNSPKWQTFKKEYGK